MARVFYIGAPLHARLPENGSVDDLLLSTGKNTGNLLIGDAIQRHLKADLQQGDLSRDPDEIKRNFDCVVIGASNFLFSGFDFGHYALFLEKVDLPCVVIGLGAQAPNFASRVEVPAGTQRMLRAISARCVSMGVRGYFTAAILIDMGIKNVRVIGCPSMFWSCQPALNFAHRQTKNDLAVALNGSANVVQHSFNIEAAKKVEIMIARLSFEKSYPYILQNERELMEIASRNGNGFDKGMIRRLMTQYGLSQMWPEAFVQRVKQNMRFYTSIESWHAAMAHFDFVTGTRFHGCLMGLLAGVPCQTIIHDARVREMCELMNIPHVDVAKIDRLDIHRLYASFDPAPVQIAYRYLYQNYIDFLEENRLEHNLIR
jgi:hypothetical protein